MEKKEYTNGEVTVIWQPKKCIHSANCAKGLSSVFQPRSKPWIKMDGASSDEIMSVIET